ncbi:TPA: hypothetical protein JIP97_001676 [Acinetobacter baumannii]|nr:hypothetical protein [Acinetobacter baumannii]
MKFLNGVCRHELVIFHDEYDLKFLNGVCRHERTAMRKFKDEEFLNGVCRHEHILRSLLCGSNISKWRMPP